MANARDFGPGKTALWVLENKWRTDVLAYGHLCEQLGGIDQHCLVWSGLNLDCAKAAKALYTRIAKLELDARRYRETVAEEA